MLLSHWLYSVSKIRLLYEKNRQLLATVSGLWRCTVLSDASRNNLKKPDDLGRFCISCLSWTHERAPQYFVWSKLWPWKGILASYLSGRAKTELIAVSVFVHQEKLTLFSTAWKRCTGCEVIVRWAHAFLFWPCLPTTMCSTHLHLFIFTSSYNQWCRDIP